MGDKFAVWRHHFENQARGLIPRQNSFYKVHSTSHNTQQEIFGKKIQIMPPSQQVVQRAKSTLGVPETIYDPVIGMQRHYTQRPRSVRKSAKKSSKKDTKKSKTKSKKPKSKSKSKKQK